MTQPANVNSTVKALLILVGIALFSIMWAWLSGGIFLELTGGKIDDATPLTLYQYWKWYGGHQVVLQKIYIAAGITTAVFVLIGLIFLKGSRATLHGDAQWASKAQVKASGLMGEDGIIVGQYGGRYLMLGGQQHVLLAAPTRSGKGVGIVIPNLLSWRDSVVVLDIKRENYNLTAGFRKQHGQAVYLFNPVASDFSTHRWNPFTYVNTDDQVFAINDIQKIANFLWPDPDNADPIWTASSRSLLLGVALYIIETPGLKLTMGECLRQATQSEETAKFFQRQINERIEAGTPLTAACVRALNDFITLSVNTRTGVRKTFTSRLELWFNPLVDAATSESDFDLRDLRKRRMSVYIAVTPDDLARVQPILNLFFQQLLDVNTKVLPQDDPALKYKCMLLMDEFTSIGKIQILSKGISYIAGYNLRMLPIIQSPAQVREVYGHDAAETFIDNHALHIIYTPKNIKVAKEISETLGNQTWKVKSLSKAVGFSKGNKSENTSDQRRALMLPQELIGMSQEREILLYEGTPPIECKKIRYYQDETFTSRLLPPPSVPMLTIERDESVITAAMPVNDQAGAEEEKADVVEQRDFTADDLDKLDGLQLEDFSCDFSSVVVEAQSLPESDMKSLTALFFSKADKAE